jgi:hypothetical protein
VEAAQLAPLLRLLVLARVLWWGVLQVVVR